MHWELEMMELNIIFFINNLNKILKRKWCSFANLLTNQPIMWRGPCTSFRTITHKEWKIKSLKYHRRQTRRKKSNFLNNLKSLWAQISDQVHSSQCFFFYKWLKINGSCLACVDLKQVFSASVVYIKLKIKFYFMCRLCWCSFAALCLCKKAQSENPDLMKFSWTQRVEEHLDSRKNTNDENEQSEVERAEQIWAQLFTAASSLW